MVLEQMDGVGREVWCWEMCMVVAVGEGRCWDRKVVLGEVVLRKKVVFGEVLRETGGVERGRWCRAR